MLTPVEIPRPALSRERPVEPDLSDNGDILGIGTFNSVDGGIDFDEIESQPSTGLDLRVPDNPQLDDETEMVFETNSAAAAAAKVSTNGSHGREVSLPDVARVEQASDFGPSDSVELSQTRLGKISLAKLALKERGAPAEGHVADDVGSSNGAVDLPLDLDIPRPGKRAGKHTFRVPRRPGPHGPSPTFMGAALLVFYAGITGFAYSKLERFLPADTGQFVQFPHSENADGTKASVNSGASANPDMTKVDPKGLVGGEQAHIPTGKATTKSEELAKAQLQAKIDKVPKKCPSGMATTSRSLCMDAGEHPGLRRVPRAGFTLQQAQGVCAMRDGRLCTWDEWRSVCEGESGNAYPYGPRPRGDVCNVASAAGFPREVTYSGAHTRCVTAGGIYDLAGNIGEWVAEGLVVGGDATTPAHQAGCTSAERPRKGYHGNDVGFRCCADR